MIHRQQANSQPLSRAARRCVAVLAGICLILSCLSGAALPAANAQTRAAVHYKPKPYVPTTKPAPSLGPRPVKRAGWSCAHYNQSCTALSTSWMGDINVNPPIAHVGQEVTATVTLHAGNDVWVDGWTLNASPLGATIVNGCGTKRTTARTATCTWKVTSASATGWQVVTVTFDNTIGYAESQDSYGVVGQGVHVLDGYVLGGDKTSTPLPGVTVYITNVGAGSDVQYSARTGDDGLFDALLPEGTYQVTPSPAGFQLEYRLISFSPESDFVHLTGDHTSYFWLSLCKGSNSCYAEYTWQMPNRFGATNASGLIDYPSVASDKASGSYQIAPTSWPVTFTLDVDGECPTSMSPLELNISQYQLTWTIKELAHDGNKPFVSDTGPFTPVTNQPCQFSHVFPEEGVYQVTLSTSIMVLPGLYLHAGDFVGKVWVKDWLIVGLGDGFASGDGAPDAGMGAGALWEDAACLRSSKSYQAQAALWLENMDPHTSVTFLQLACAGAGWLNSYAAPYGGASPGVAGSPAYSLSGQLDAMKADIGDRTPDAILISIGVNDVDYGNALGFCSRKSWDFTQAFAQLEPGKSFTTDCPDTHYPTETSSGTLLSTLKSDVQGMRPGFDQFFQHLKAAGIPASHVYLVEYPDPTTDASGGTCQKMSFTATQLISGTNQLVTLPGLNYTDAQILGGIVRSVNSSWQKHAAQVGYHYIGNVSASFDGHGYCAGDPYVNTATASATAQGDPSAATYPTSYGYSMMAVPVEEALQNDLYPGGVERSH